MRTKAMRNAMLAAVLAGLVAPAGAQELPEIAGKIAFSCVDQARSSAGTWRNACVELGGTQQECRIEARAIFEFVLSQCFTSMTQVLPVRLIE